MKKIWKKMKLIPLPIYVAVVLIAFSVLLGFGKYSVSFMRLKVVLKDFGLLWLHYFRFVYHVLFLGDASYITKVQLPLNSFESLVIANDAFGFGAFFEGKWELLSDYFFDGTVFFNYILWLMMMLYRALLFLILFAVVGYLFYTLAVDMILTDKEKPVGYLSKPLVAFISFLRCAVQPTLKAIRNIVTYFAEHKILCYALLFIWCMNLNVLTLLLEIFSFLLYFSVSFDFVALIVRLVHILADLFITFTGLPIVIWFVLVLGVLYVRWRRKAMDELRHKDAKNCGLLKSLSYILLLKGRPGLGKTTLLTSFSLYYVNIFKEDSFDTLYDIEMTFPAFPFANFRQALNERIESGLLFCLPSCDLYVDELQAVYEATPSPCVLFGYEADLFGLDRDEGNRVAYLFDSLRDYAKAYYVYLCQNPSVSNYPIRFDGEFDDSEYFPLWDGDFYNKNPREAKEKSRYSHIYDKDITRLGKKIDENGKYNGTFGFGIWSDMEMGKSRGNQHTNEIFRADDIEANPKNDLYVLAGAYVRQNYATIDYKCYCRMINDEQRPETLSADVRELMQVIDIAEKSELKLAIRGYRWFEKVYDHVYVPFKDFYKKYMNARGDVVLSVFLLKLAVSAISGFYKRLYNRYGYYTLKLKIEDGTAYGNAKDGTKEAVYHDYELMVWQIYSDRYLTDSMKTFFSKEQLEAKLGINDYECYSGLAMTDEEMIKQKDYTIMKMMRRTYGDIGDDTVSGSKKKSGRSFDDFEIETF